MAPFVKDNDSSTAAPDKLQRPSAAGLANETVNKQQPVALEVPVTVNGARTVDGSDKREPFSETTNTVLIFGNGAVIRLTSSVASGQLLFLTNEKTKKEVVCQVVKSKNYRNVSGYVELEFTEPVVGFWGMRFPGDRLGPAPVARPTVPAPSNGHSAAPSMTKPVAPVVPAKSPEPRVSQPNTAAPVAPAAAAPSTLKAEEAAPQKPIAPVPAVTAKQTSSFDPSAPVAASTQSAPSVEAPTPSFSFDFSRATDSKASFLEPASGPNSAVPSIVFAAEPKEIIEPPVASKPEPQPVAPVRVEAPVAPAPEPVAPVKMEAPAPPKVEAPAQEKLEAPTPSFVEAPRASDAKASFLEPAVSQGAPVQSSVPNLLALFESKPGFPQEPLSAAPPATPAVLAVDDEAEDLKKRTTRVQEQLSGMNFSGENLIEHKEPETTYAADAHTNPTLLDKELADNARRLFESMKMQSTEQELELPAGELVQESAPAKLTSLNDDQLGIPAWLEPLARNATAPLSTQELLEREKAKRISEKTNVEELISDSIAEPVVAEKEESTVRPLPVPTFGELAPLENAPAPRPIRKRNSNSALLMGAVAAGVLLAAGGAWWYITQPPAGSRETSPAVTNEVVPANSAPAASAPVQNPSKAAQPNAAPAPANSPAPSDLSLRTTTAKNATPVPATEKTMIPGKAQATKSPEAPAQPSAIQPSAEQPKKSAIGDVHLAAPVVAARGKKQASDVDAGINLTSDDQPASGADALNSGLVQASSQPAAPVSKLAVGGDVKQAVLISSVPPMYPAMARTQRVSGSVVVDALIEPNGRVSTMKVVSGPPTLQQAAMDAIKQWKYRPATLDGSPVAMHLTVTIQFRAPQ